MIIHSSNMGHGGAHSQSMRNLNRLRAFQQAEQRRSTTHATSPLGNSQTSLLSTAQSRFSKSGNQLLESEPNSPESSPATTRDAKSTWKSVTRKIVVANKISRAFTPTQSETSESHAGDYNPQYHTPRSWWWGNPFLHTKLLTLWDAVDDPSSSTLAYVWSVWVFALIALSSGSFVLETIPETSHWHPDLWMWIEVFCMGWFTLEFLLRLISNPFGLRQFSTEMLNIVDVVAILPFYIEMLIERGSTDGFAVLRLVRFVRIMRLFKFSRRSLALRVLFVTIKQSVSPMSMLFLLVMISGILFSSAMFFFERGTWSPQVWAWVNYKGEKSHFQSIFDGMWWYVVTVTTTGLGDVYPITVGGQITGIMAMMTGVVVLALPISVIGSSFQEELLFQSMRKQQQDLLQKEHDSLQNEPLSEARWDQIIAQTQEILMRPDEFEAEIMQVPGLRFLLDGDDPNFRPERCLRVVVLFIRLAIRVVHQRHGRIDMRMLANKIINKSRASGIQVQKQNLETIKRNVQTRWDDHERHVLHSLKGHLLALREQRKNALRAALQKYGKDPEGLRKFAEMLSCTTAQPVRSSSDLEEPSTPSPIVTPTRELDGRVSSTSPAPPPPPPSTSASPSLKRESMSP